MSDHVKSFFAVLIIAVIGVGVGFALTALTGYIFHQGFGFMMPTALFIFFLFTFCIFAQASLVRFFDRFIGV